MDKTIAADLLQYASRRQGQELAKWRGAPARMPERQVEAQRLRVAACAIACQELYAMAHPDERILTAAGVKEQAS